MVVLTVASEVRRGSRESGQRSPSGPVPGSLGTEWFPRRPGADAPCGARDLVHVGPSTLAPVARLVSPVAGPEGPEGLGPTGVTDAQEEVGPREVDTPPLPVEVVWSGSPASVCALLLPGPLPPSRSVPAGTLRTVSVPAPGTPRPGRPARALGSPTPHPVGGTSGRPPPP